MEGIEGHLGVGDGRPDGVLIAGRGRELAQRYAGVWQGFASVLERTLRTERITDGDELARVYRDLVEGRSDPAKGYVVSLGS